MAVDIETYALAKKYTDTHGGGGGGTSNYESLSNKPKINGHELSGDMSAEDLDLKLNNFLGVTTTELSDGSATNPITINGEEITAESGDYCAYESKEFFFNGDTWGEYGDLSAVTYEALQDKPSIEGEELNGDKTATKLNLENKLYFNVKGKRLNILHKPNNIPIVTWADGTPDELKAMLDAHYKGFIDIYDYWNVGDVRTANGGPLGPPTQLILTHKGGKTLESGAECAFQVDDKLLKPYEGIQMYDMYESSLPDSVTWKASYCRSTLNSKDSSPYSYEYYIEYYRNGALPGVFKSFYVETGKDYASNEIELTLDKFALRSEVEIFGTSEKSVAGEGSQVEWYTDINNRKRTNMSGNTRYWLRSPAKGIAKQFLIVGIDGDSSSYYGRPASYIYPGAVFGVI